MDARALLRKAYEVGKVLYDDMDRCDLFKHASGMAYVTLLSLVPSLAAVFGLASIFAPFSGEKAPVVARVKDLILENLTPGTGEQVVAYLDHFLANLEVGKIGITGFVGILVSLTLLMRQIELALNNVFDVRDERGFVSRFVYFWTIFTLGTFLASIGIGILAGFDASNLANWSGIKPLYTFGAKVFSVASVFVVFVVLYKFVPNCRVNWKSSLTGALLATMLFYVASQGYGFFISRFTNYAVIYGALAAIPVFLFWIYLLWLIVLFGSVITYRLELGLTLKHEETRRLSPEERLHAGLLRVALPALTLKAAYDAFQAGIAPVGSEYIARRIGASDGAVTDSLRLLENAGWVQGVSSSTPDRRQFLLTKPADKVRLGAVVQSLSISAGESAVARKWFDAIAGRVTDQTTFADV